MNKEQLAQQPQITISADQYHKLSWLERLSYRLSQRHPEHFTTFEVKRLREVRDILASISPYPKDENFKLVRSGEQPEPSYTSTSALLNDFLNQGTALEAFVISDEDRKRLEAHMEQFDFEKRKKAAQALIDLSQLIITI